MSCTADQEWALLRRHDCEPAARCLVESRRARQKRKRAHPKKVPASGKFLGVVVVVVVVPCIWGLTISSYLSDSLQHPSVEDCSYGRSTPARSQGKPKRPIHLAVLLYLRMFPSQRATPMDPISSIPQKTSGIELYLPIQFSNDPRQTDRKRGPGWIPNDLSTSASASGQPHHRHSGRGAAELPFLLSL